MDRLLELLPLLIPLILIQIGLAVYALIVLHRAKRVRGDSKLLWALVIIFINLFGPVIFLFLGRLDDATGSEDE
ncbi:MAG: PLDc_N domain-containing protein [Acholeplasmataceae bacterium]|nr:MAG: PLDc_N domain-containing protein [Acholeplasmataceae bacterium]